MTSPTIIVDRIEGDRAVLECGGEFVDFPLSFLPQGTSEGDIISTTITKADTSSLQQRLDKLAERTADLPDDIEL